MEGREYSSTGDVYPNHHIRPNSDSDEDEFDDLIERNDGTYVIQVPKDQIYRVPPPENAIFAEQKRIAVPERKTIFTANCMLLFALILSLVITFITGVSLAVADKEDPTFRVRQISVTTKGKVKHKQHEFEFTLRSKNTNGRAVLSFEKGGKAALAFRDKFVAKGTFPIVEQDTESIEKMKLKLVSGSGKTLPKLIQKSMNGSSGHIKLSLGFKVPLSFKVGVFPVKSKSLSIVCNLKVKGLSKHTRILSQDCDYSTS